MIAAPRSANMSATVLLPLPMPPVNPIFNTMTPSVAPSLGFNAPAPMHHPL